MKKGQSIVLMVLIVVVAIFFFLNKETRVENLSTEALSKILISQKIIDNEDIDDQPIVILADAVDTKTKKVVRVIEIPEWSGTGGSRAIITVTNLKGENLVKIADFFGSKESLQKTFTVVDGIVSFDEVHPLSSCSYTTSQIEINLLDQSLSKTSPVVENNNCSN